MLQGFASGCPARGDTHLGLLVHLEQHQQQDKQRQDALGQAQAAQLAECFH